MEEILPHLEGVFYIATVEEDQPHVRPFDAAVIREGKLYIGTNSNKKVYQQILKNPKVEIFEMGQGMLRMTAEAYPVEDKEENLKIYEAMGKDPKKEYAVALELRKIRANVTDAMSGETKEIIS